MKEIISKLASTYPESGIRKMFTLAAQFNDVINLCNGEPDFDTPQNIIDKAIESLKHKDTKYGSEGGLPALQSAIAEKYTKQFNRTFSKKNVMISAGGVEGIMLSLMTIINPGDEVIIPNPAYTCYEGQVKLLGGIVIRVPLKEEYHFRLQPEDLESAITPKTKAIILNYPTNPVGAVLEKADAEKLATVIIKHDLYVISDEVYEKIIFDGRTHYSIAQVPGMEDRVLIVNSFSKTYAMTGWRLGYVISSNEKIMSSISTMQQPLIACLPVFVMKAGVEALTNSQNDVIEMQRQYEKRRNLIYGELCKVPKFKVFKTEGSFCIYINIKEWNISSEEMAINLLENAKVLTVSGSAFGSEGNGYLRMCFANSEENILEGTKRIRNYLEALDNA